MTDREFPPALREVSGVEFPYDDDEDIDFEPFDAFLSGPETTAWLRAWTGNPDVDGDIFRVFGQDGTGGYAAFWMCRAGEPLDHQPVVFLGSEGEVGVVAADLVDFLWLLADGSGPYEAVESPNRASRLHRELTAIADRYGPDSRRPAAELVTTARQEFPEFSPMIESLVR